jgi:uncharacterized damage-inducible protein DinB
LSVEGVTVCPPVTESQARGLIDVGALADTRDGLLEAWRRTSTTWEETVTRARCLPDHALERRVDGEWSFSETLRHLVMVSDAWVRRLVLGIAQPFHPIGIAPHFIPDPATMGLDGDATPTLDEVLEVRRERLREVESAIIDCDDVKLLEPTVELWPRLGVFQVVLVEEWAHHSFATRDLAVLER